MSAELHRLHWDEAGFVKASRARSTGVDVIMYRPGGQLAAEEGWVLLCDTHGRLITHDTRRLAERFMPAPEEWCEVCMGNEPPDEED